MNSTTGLVATSHAPITPIASSPSRRPMPNVASTSRPADSGTTQNIASCPPISFAAASSIGSPGEYTGTITLASSGCGR
jgi:hypothetical protein